MPVQAPPYMTAEELLAVNMPGKSTELVRGRLVVREPPGIWHGLVSARLLVELARFVSEGRLGEVFAQDTGFKVFSDPDTVRAPDVSFLARGRLRDIPRQGYAALAPDLAAEILSPSDRAGEVMAKIGDWLEAGSRLVWVIDPIRRTARVYRPDGELTLVDADGVLEGEDVLPGFQCKLSALLADPGTPSS